MSDRFGATRVAKLAALLLVVFSGSIFAQTPPPTRAPPKFPPGAIWNQDISGVLPDSNSGTMITSSVGWGTGTRVMQIDFSMHVLYTTWAGFTNEPLVKKNKYYTGECDSGYSIPVPTIGAIEGSTDYTCGSDDCHMFIVNGSTLYETYSTTIDASGVHALCLLKWHLNLVYPPNGRGDRCTSADAAGFPMAPLITNANEVWNAIPANGGTGDLGHALRFIMPNDRMRPGFYVHPATHSGVPDGNGPADAIPYGARLRLHPLFSTTGFNPAAKVILATMKKYGMFLSDGGSLPLTFEDDMFTSHKWDDADLNVDSQLLYPHGAVGPALSDFDVMPIGTPIAYDDNNDDCVRNPDDIIYADSVEW